MLENEDEIKIERTGNLYSFSSVEFLVTFPDKTETKIWSPPWSDLDYDDPRQDEGALTYAKELWAKRFDLCPVCNAAPHEHNCGRE